VGSKLAVVHGDIRYNTTFYNVKNAIQALKTIQPKQQANAVYWSPGGQFCVLAGLKSVTSGTLLFVDTNDMSVMRTHEHTGVTDIEWDPTGRYVVTAVSAWGGKGTYGYILWSFQGQQLQVRNVQRFTQFLWRPRPPTLLTEAQIKEVRKTMKNYYVRFQELDKQSKTKASKEIVEKRRGMVEAFEEWRKKCRPRWELDRSRRIELRGEDTDRDASERVSTADLVEERLELLIKKEETIVGE